MIHEYKILILEDLTTDAELIEWHLQKGGLRFKCRRVETESDFITALTEYAPDVILSDYTLPGFDGLSALRIALKIAPHIPFIVVTGSINEETAVHCMKTGAMDYILKENLARLVPAIISALDKRYVLEEKKRAEARLRLMEAAVVNAADMVIIAEADPITEPGPRVVYVNPAFTKITGYAAEEVIGLTPRLLQGPKTDSNELSKIHEALIKGQPARAEVINYRKDGSEFWVELNIMPVPDAFGRITHWVSIQRDITERRRAEEELRQSQAQLAQSQKMEAVGRLAGGIAHDFNNLLTVIMGFSQLVLKRLGQDHPLRNEVEQIREAGERAAALTSQLLAFSRKQVAQPRVLNLGEVVSGVKKILQRLIGEDIELTTIIDPETGGVKVDQGQIEQVIFNLVVNARDAMEQGGKLTIGVKDVDLDDAYARTHLSAIPGAYTVMTVSDTGKGMDAETKAHIFEPFFTTKEMGRGTGLGLAMVYGIVKQNNGFIWVYSEPGVGTTFKIYFPRADGKTEEVKSETDKEVFLPRGEEVILLAEDEVAVRRLTRELLEMQGYKVLEAASGEEALQLSHRHSQIDLLLTDVIMPRISGRELATRLCQQRPNLKVLYMSGYTDDTIVKHGLLEEDLAFIQKPFSQELLVRKVRAVLDEEVGGGV